jgi:hypothetical protein
VNGRVSVIVPFRNDDVGYRGAAWHYVQCWWRRHHPGWQVVRGNLPDGPWIKALAIDDALARADGDVLVLADADVFGPGFSWAVDHVSRGTHAWAMPHQRVHRLTLQASSELYAGGQLPNPGDRHRVHESYTGHPGGGAVVIPRASYQRFPMDPRFVGWGSEDDAAGMAWDVLLGPPWRPDQAPLWHLWHPPQPRIHRAWGSEASRDLCKRYKAAQLRHSKERMSSLVAEYTSPAVLPSRSSSTPAPPPLDARTSAAH